MNVPGPLEFTVAPEIDAVPGTTTNLYFAETIKSTSVAGLTFEFSQGPGVADATHWTWTPGSDPDEPIVLRLLQGGVEIGRSEFTMRPRFVTAKPVRILLVGDSLTWQNFYPNDLAAKMTAAGIPFTMLGSSTGDAGNPLNPGVHHEGFSGYATSTFVTQGPFVFLENGVFVLDFARWIATTAGGVPPDICIVELGINDITQARIDTASIYAQQSLAFTDQLFANMRAAAPNMLIGHTLITPPNLNPATWTAPGLPLSTWVVTRQALLNACLTHNYGPNTFSLGTSCGIAQANYTDNVHPNAAGYLELSNQVFAAIVARFLTPNG